MRTIIGLIAGGGALFFQIMVLTSLWPFILALLILGLISELTKKAIEGLANQTDENNDQNLIEKDIETYMNYFGKRFRKKLYR